MFLVFIIMAVIMFAAGAVYGYTVGQRQPVDRSLENRYRRALIAIASDRAGNPQIEAQDALEQEDKK